jgi:hypothetical protein
MATWPGPTRSARRAISSAKAVALGHHVAAEGGKPAVHRRLGLNVTDVVDAVVHQGQRRGAERPSLGKRLQLAIEEVAAFAAHEDSRLPAGRGTLDLRRGDGGPHSEPGEQLRDPGQLATVIGVGLARPERAAGPQPLHPVRHKNPKIGHRRQCDRGHPGPLRCRQGIRDFLAAQQACERVDAVQAGQEATAWMAVDVDPRCPASCHAS